jgi:hypothetical protein
VTRRAFVSSLRAVILLCFAAAGVFAGLDGELNQARVWAVITFVNLASSYVQLSDSAR